MNFILKLTELEIVKGYDGLLRGKPEPVVLIGAYVIDGTRALLVDRRLTTFAPTQPFPSTVAPQAFDPIYVEIKHHDELYFALLAMALEEDGREDIITLYGALERPDQLKLWASASDEPSPLGLLELGRDDTWLYPTCADLLVDGLDAASQCRLDQWVGAVAWTFPSHHAPWPCTVRLPFCSPGGRNDWTALIDVRQGNLTGAPDSAGKAPVS